MSAAEIQPRWNNLPEMFFEQAGKFGARPALREKKGGAWRTISWTDWAADVRRLAGGLVKLGIKPGDAVSIIGRNRPEWVTADFATMAAGAVLVPVYVTLLPKDIAYILANADVRVMIVDNEAQLAKVLEVRADLPKLEKIVLIDGNPPAGDAGVVRYIDVLESGTKTKQEDLAAIYGALRPNDLFTIIYTSGTTGPPKGVRLTHGNILWVLEAGHRVLNAKEGDEFVSFLPLCHVFERVGGLFAAVYAGIVVNFAQSLDTLIADIGEARPTILLTVPRMLEKAYQAALNRVENSSAFRRALFHWALSVGRQTGPYRLADKPLPAALQARYLLAKTLVFGKIKKRFGGRLRFMVSGGAPLSPEIAEFFLALDILILEGYGMTELSAPSTINTPGGCKIGTVGRPLPGVDVRIADDGEILVRAPSVFDGYHKLPDLTAETVVDGWMHTGDIGAFDEDGFLKITDRKKDLIITSGGKNIAPQNLENRLKADPFVNQAMVYGDRRKYLTALIVPDADAVRAHFEERGLTVTASVAESPEIRALLLERVAKINAELPSYETIKDFRLLDHEFTETSGELTPTLKLKRKIITQKYATLLEEMYR